VRTKTYTPTTNTSFFFLLSLLLKPLSLSLSLDSVINEATTVFSTFQFAPSFFETFRVSPSNNNNNHNNNNTNDSDLDSDLDSDSPASSSHHSRSRRKKSSSKTTSACWKALLKPTANVLHTAKRAERLTLQYHTKTEEYGMTTSILTLTLQCQHSVLKTFSFHVESIANLVEAEFDPYSDGPNSFSMRPTLLQSLLDRIHGAREISLEVQPKKGLRLTTHHHDDSERSNSLSSNLFVPSMELKTLLVHDPHDHPARSSSGPSVNSVNSGTHSGTHSGTNSGTNSGTDEDHFSSSSQHRTNISGSKHVLIFPSKCMKAFVSFCLAQQLTSNNITVMFNVIGAPLLLTSRTRNSVLSRAQKLQKRKEQNIHKSSSSSSSGGGGGSSSSLVGGGSFSAEMIIATVAPTELQDDELESAKDDSAVNSSSSKRKRY